jgi:transcriptional regulator with XRE-family HTH domain
MSLNSRQSLYEKMKDKKYRDAFVESRISQTLALQARVLRQEAGMSQEELAKKLGTSQNAISRLESPKYGKPSISTLKRYASLFDVGLIVRFVSYSRLIDWTEPDEFSILVPPFAKDTGFIEEEINSIEAYEDGLVAALLGKSSNRDNVVDPGVFDEHRQKVQKAKDQAGATSALLSGGSQNEGIIRNASQVNRVRRDERLESARSSLLSSAGAAAG